jgi:nucleotide-binding universal stress UspA family protein
MEMYKKILVAVDGSPYSRLAVPAAIEMAQKFEAEVLVVHVSEHDRGRAAAYTLETPAEATRLVADAVKQVHDAGPSAHGELLDRAAGHVAPAIVEAAQAHGADLIIMGSRGLSDGQAVLVGSVTHKVLQLAQIPVLIARPPKQTVEPVQTAAAVTAR